MNKPSVDLRHCLQAIIRFPFPEDAVRQTAEAALRILDAEPAAQERAEPAVWMIERKAKDDKPPAWWTGGARLLENERAFTEDPNSGIRFADAPSATAALIALAWMSLLPEHRRDAYTISEHAWPTPAQPPVRVEAPPVVTPPLSDAEIAAALKALSLHDSWLCSRGGIPEDRLLNVIYTAIVGARS